MTLQPKVGQLFCRVNKGGPPEHVRVELGEEELRVSRHDMVYEDVLATKVRGRGGGGERERERERGGQWIMQVHMHTHAQDIVDRRRVLLQRSEDGLGIAILVGWSASDHVQMIAAQVPQSLPPTIHDEKA